MAHALQHACEHNQAFQQQNWQRLPRNLHTTDSGGSEGLFFARSLAAGATFSSIPSGLNGG
jgi:hypothetical protein